MSAPTKNVPDSHLRFSYGDAEKKSNISNLHFGSQLRHLFPMDKSITFCNHGAFGATPLRVLDCQRRLQDEMHRWPSHFMWHRSLGLWKEALEHLAEFVGTKSENLVFVPNTTTGINTVMKSIIDLQPGDAIAGSSLTYGAMQFTLEETARIRPGIEALFLEIKFPILSKEDILEEYVKFLDAHPNIKVVLADHITSPTAVVMPIEEIINLCHKRNILVVIDGAHAPGQLELNLDALDVDFYTSSIHKWMYTGKSCGFLYVNPRHIHPAGVRPLITSWNYKTNMHEEFWEDGTRDQTPYMTVPDAISFISELGGVAGIRTYCIPLADKAADYLSREWNMEKLPIPKDMEAPYMRLIRLPEVKGYRSGNMTDANALRRDFFLDRNVQITTFPIAGATWLRISVAPYNCFADYVTVNTEFQAWRQKKQSTN